MSINSTSETTIRSQHSQNSRPKFLMQRIVEVCHKTIPVLELQHRCKVIG